MKIKSNILFLFKAFALYSCSILLLLPVSGNAQNFDTIINKTHYNTILFYQNNFLRGPVNNSGRTVLAYGTTLNEKKEGEWIYFDQDGRKLAEGKYKEDLKLGVWYYYPQAGLKIKLKWKKNQTRSESIIIEEGKTQIVDVLEYSIKYINGKKQHSKTRFL